MLIGVSGLRGWVKALSHKPIAWGHETPTPEFPNSSQGVRLVHVTGIYVEVHGTY